MHYNEVNTFKESVMLKAWTGNKQGEIVDSEAGAGVQQGNIEAAADSEAENEDQEAATKARAPTGVVGGKGSMELTWVPLMVLMVKKHSMILLK